MSSHRRRVVYIERVPGWLAVTSFWYATAISISRQSVNPAVTTVLWLLGPDTDRHHSLINEDRNLMALLPKAIHAVAMQNKPLVLQPELLNKQMVCA